MKLGKLASLIIFILFISLASPFFSVDKVIAELNEDSINISEEIPLTINTNQLSGSKSLSFYANETMDSVNVSVCNSERELYEDQAVYQDWIPYIWDESDYNKSLKNCSYQLIVQLENVTMFDVHIIGELDNFDVLPA